MHNVYLSLPFRLYLRYASEQNLQENDNRPFFSQAEGIRQARKEDD